MALIERDLEQRKAQLKKLAIDLQRLEEAPAKRGTVAYREKNRELAAMRQRIEVLKFGIGELEETIADHKRHVRDRERNVKPKRPDQPQGAC
jgi:chromosome segregation ATPase